MSMVFNIYFIMDYLLNIYVAENKLLFAFYSSSMLEYVSIIPSFLARLGVIEGSEYIYLTRIIRFLAIRKLDKILARHSMEGKKLIRNLKERLFIIFFFSYKTHFQSFLYTQFYSID